MEAVPQIPLPDVRNIGKDERRSIEDLKKRQDIMILPADKGKATVVLDKDDYKTKVKRMLSDTKTYKVLKKDPTPTYILSRPKQEEKISSQQYDHLYPTQENIPRLYCTPKIHKPGAPLRPIVDYTLSLIHI